MVLHDDLKQAAEDDVVQLVLLPGATSAGFILLHHNNQS
jgi:hypothetical protein